MQVGLIGGIGPAAQDYYTHRLIGLFADTSAPLDMTTVYADALTVLDNLAADRRVEQAEIFGRLADRLVGRRRICRCHIDCWPFLPTGIPGAVSASRRRYD